MAVLAVVRAGTVAVVQAPDELRAPEAEHGGLRFHDAVAAALQFLEHAGREALTLKSLFTIQRGPSLAACGFWW